MPNLGAYLHVCIRINIRMHIRIYVCMYYTHTYVCVTRGETCHASRDVKNYFFLKKFTWGDSCHASLAM
jgi:hypothetical protein